MTDMNKKHIRVGICENDSYIREEIEYALTPLMNEYEAIYDHENPDVLFYDTYSGKHLNYSRDSTVMVGWYGENIYPNYNIAHYSISHVRDTHEGKNFYSPLYVWKTLRKAKIITTKNLEVEKRKFAIFIASQDSTGYGASLRKNFVEYVQRMYRRVDCPGKVLHNIDLDNELGSRFCNDWQERKQRLLNRYKFVVSFENSNTDGYISEKLVDAFLSGTVPIYWGSEGNIAPFPKEAVICANDYDSFDSLLAFIKEVDENEELYRKILEASPLNRPGALERIVSQHQMERTEFLRRIFELVRERQPRLMVSPFRHVDLSVSPSGFGAWFDELYTRPSPRALCGNTLLPRAIEWWKGTARLYPLKKRFYTEKKKCPFLNYFHIRPHND